MPITYLLGLIGVTATFNQRLLDPLTPLVASSLAVHTDLAVLLAPAMTLPFALGQPFLGPLGDAYGKARLLKVCTVIMALSSLGATFAPNYATLFAMRMLTGFAAGGIIPASIALIADRFPVAERQVAMSRFMTLMMVGQIFAAPVSAAVAETVHWRVVLFAAGLFALVGFAVAALNLKPRPGVVRTPFSVRGSLATYGAILAHPVARICYVAVACEGLFLFGFTPHMALLLAENDAGGVREAGFVLAAHGLGGLVFAAMIGPLARRLQRHTLMRVGGLVAAAGLVLMPLAPVWQAAAVASGLVGFGFFLYHSGLQTEITEVMPSARASAVSLHAFFMFLGIAAAPVLFGWLEDVIRPRGAFWFCAVAMLVSALSAARLLQVRADESETAD